MEPLYVAILLMTGAVAGFASGMLGIGGCFIMVPVQFWILTAMNVDPTIAIRISFGTALAAALPTAINGAIGHRRKGVVVEKAALLLGISGMFGAFLGGTLATHVPASVLKTTFGLIILIAAIKMTTEDAKPTKKPETGTLPFLIFGLPLGFICGLIGIGGGTIMVPVMVTLMGFRIHQAVGTSTAAIIFTSSGGVASYMINGLGAPDLPAYSVGYVNLHQLILLAGTSIPMARTGVWAAHRLPAESLKRIFALLMLYVSLKMIGLFELLHLPI